MTSAVTARVGGDPARGPGRHRTPRRRRPRNDDAVAQICRALLDHRCYSSVTSTWITTRTRPSSGPAR
jgi:hypothetical protein